MYTLTDEESGALIHTFQPSDYPANTAQIALKQAMTQAKRLARTGRIILVDGPELEQRRLTRLWAQKNPAGPYRVRCPSCRTAWVRPTNGRERGPHPCRECYRSSGVATEAVNRRWNKSE